MKNSFPFLFTASLCLLVTSANLVQAQPAAGSPPYKVVKSAQFAGTGGIDYVFAESEDRRLYVPRGSEILVFDLDTLQSVGSIADTRARGVAIARRFHHGFSSSNPVVMWDTKTLATIKTIDVQGRPDGILFEPATERIYVFSHSAPHATVIDANDGAVVGTLDLGGAPEQAASDGGGRLYVDIEDKDKVAVVDVRTLKVITHYGLGGKGGVPAGLALDATNNVLFVFCREPQTCVVLDATDGAIIATLPIGRGTDGGVFNPATMEAFSSQGDGTLTVIKENSPSSFVVVQTVETKPRAKTCSLDARKNQIVLIATEPIPEAAPSKAAPTDSPTGSATQRGSKKAGGGGPGLLDILVVGR